MSLDLFIAQLTHVELFGAARGDTRNALISAGYLLAGGFLVFYAGREAETIRAIGVAIILVGSLLAWVASRKRSRLVADTPTAPLRSAPQGYVELVGRSEPCPGAQTLGFGMLPACVWYKVKSFERQRYGGRDSVAVNVRISDDMFLLVDATGECVVDPDHAEIMTTNKRTWQTGDTRYAAWYLRPGDTLYALGELQTERSSDGTLDRRADVAALLKGWKQDKRGLLREYDTDGDGQVDVQEWQGAVEDAERIVDERHGEMRLQPGINVLRAPRDRRYPFLLSNRDPDNLMRRYKWWSWFHLAVLMGTTTYGLRTWL